MFLIILNGLLKNCQNTFELKVATIKNNIPNYWNRQLFIIFNYYDKTNGYLWFLSGILALRFHDEDHANLLNSMWLTAITFLCVGYGDIVPNTYCGRGITLTCGMVVCMNNLVGYLGGLFKFIFHTFIVARIELC